MLHQIICYPNICTANTSNVATQIRQMLLHLDGAVVVFSFYLFIFFVVFYRKFFSYMGFFVHCKILRTTSCKDISAGIIFSLNSRFKVASANYGWLNAFSTY